MSKPSHKEYPWANAHKRRDQWLYVIDLIRRIRCTGPWPEHCLAERVVIDTDCPDRKDEYSYQIYCVDCGEFYCMKILDDDFFDGVIQKIGK